MKPRPRPRHLVAIMLLAMVAAISGSLIGLFGAYFFDIPSGAAIIFFLTLQYLMIRLVTWKGLKQLRG